MMEYRHGSILVEPCYCRTGKLSAFMQVIFIRGISDFERLETGP